MGLGRSIVDEINGWMGHRHECDVLGRHDGWSGHDDSLNK